MRRLILVAFTVLAVPLAAQSGDSTIPDLDSLRRAPVSELAAIVDRWSIDRSTLLRRYDADGSPVQRNRLVRLNEGWLDALAELPFEQLSREGQVDYILLQSHITHQLSLQKRAARRAEETAPLLPFADTLWTMLEERRLLIHPDPEVAAARLAWMIDTLTATRQTIERGLKAAGSGPRPSVALRAREELGSMQRDFDSWQGFYLGYDPEVTWRIREPAKAFAAALEQWHTFLGERLVGIRKGEDAPIVGDPIGREGLIADLANEMIPYTPEELLDLAGAEFAMLEAEARAASREMGLGDDWKAALERTKNDYPPVGEQVGVVRDLAREASDYVISHKLISVPTLAQEVWRMEMMSAEAQKTNPFFLGGEVIQVASPTDGMSEAEKMMALRANNRHFSRATVFHELIPGHELQGFAARRSNPHRRIFSTPFYSEGWSLWWEMHLWDLGFPATPEDRMGMLFWRMHRAARIIFSINFHLGNWTPAQCIEFLVERVGHERASATGEVRRSFNGDYSPLYQAGYLLGGMQLRALHGELVSSGRMNERAFHDAVLATGPMPIAMVRALLDPRVPLSRDFRSSWRFAE